jgi:hypothetical protein
VAETFIGLMLGDSHSFLSQSPDWHPKDETFHMSDLIKMAIAVPGIKQETNVAPGPPKSS